MTTQELAKTEIARLVKSFKDLPAAQRKGMNEMQTRLGYILPLFRALGWDTSNINEVSPEEKVSRGWVDFSFRIGNVPRFFLETKKVNEDLNDARWVKQSIDYAWTKSVTWALLSDFEGLKVFNAEWQADNPFQSVFIEFDLETYLSDFERLWWLSREETVAKRLDKEAERWGKRSKRQPVSQHLFDNLKHWRGILHKDYQQFNSLLAAEADAIVLRLLNRLIFIRTAEDREVEEIRLRSLVRELEGQKKFAKLPEELSRLFREFDKTYNSELFAPHSLDGAYATPSNLKEVIEGLYGTKYLTYNFNALESDVLGTVYEQYLGSIVTGAPKDGKPVQPSLLAGEVLEVTERRQKRKSQGIYYTPTFVTKYIVQQTVGKYLEEQGYNPSHPPRVLDMACGSGSFLIEAFDVIDRYVMTLRRQGTPSGLRPPPPNPQQDAGQSVNRLNADLGEGRVGVFDRARQLEVLQNCIFGVDKDKQAVEVARLNLLLRALHSREKLPMLENIAYGDSLHSETFEVNFPEVLKEGGFDVIVGNPPYIRAENMPRAERDYYMAGTFETAYGRFDIFILFVELGLRLLKDGGRLSFIIPYAGLTQNYAKLLRRFILHNCVVETIVDLSKYKVFEQAEVATCILVLRKEMNPDIRNTNLSRIIQQKDYSSGIFDGNFSTIVQSEYQETVDNMFRLELAGAARQLAEKIETISLQLGRICYAITGMVAHDSKTGASKDRLIHINKRGDNFKPYLEAKETAGRYSPLKPVRFIEYRPSEMHRPKFPELFENPKILIPDIIGAGGLNGTLDLSGIYTNHSFNCCVPKLYLVGVERNLGITTYDAELSRSYAIEYLLGLINSRLMTYYFTRILGGGLHASPANVRRLPIRRIDFENPAEKSAHDEIVNLVESMLSLQKERGSVRREEDLDRVRSLEKQIAQVDAEIDQRVYALYGLTGEEIRIVEGK